MSAIFDPAAASAALTTSGFSTLPGPFATAEAGFSAAHAVITACPADARLPPIETIGDYVIPPEGGPPSRDFQTLHFDFGLPLNPVRPSEIARYTALHIPAEAAPTKAITRLVPLARLLQQRTWPDATQLLSRLVAYGHTHGAWVDADGYTEGSLARIVEAADGHTPQLPSVKTHPDFLCGNEFPNLTTETRFFRSHGLDVPNAELEVRIAPGTVTVFDNLALAHGRRGIREPGELHQRVFGHRALDISQQRVLRNHVLDAFNPRDRA
jgi:hypothetical protein